MPKNLGKQYRRQTAPPLPNKQNRGGGKCVNDVSKCFCVCQSMCTHTCKKQLMTERGEKFMVS